jgi:hypothetical protein
VMRFQNIINYVEFVVLTAVVMKIVIFSDIALYSPYMNRRLWETYHGFLLGWFSTLKMEMIRSSEMSNHMRTTQRYIQENDNFYY